MQISLKRAHEVGKQALKAAADAKMTVTIERSVFSTVVQNADELKQERNKARNATVDEVVRSIELIRAAYRIRALLAKANLACGIDELLNQNKRLQAEEEQQKKLLALLEREHGITDVEEAVTTAKALRESPREDRYTLTRKAEITVALFDREHLDQQKRLLREIARDRLKLSERQTVLNVTTTVTLDDATVKTLTAASLLFD